MRAHDHDHDESASLRPRSARLGGPARSPVTEAAAAGRWDAVGAGGMLDLQRLAGNQGVINSGGGQPLDLGVRADMEARLGHDFGDVRVHHDARAEDSARAVNAHAYTVGSNIVFQRDHYDPSSEAGRVTLAHELTHVIQQRSGPVDGTAAPGGIRLSDPSDRFEREAAATAERAMGASLPDAVTTGKAPAGTADTQRQPDEHEDEETAIAQGAFVQRDEGEEEIEE